MQNAYSSWSFLHSLWDTIFTGKQIPLLLVSHMQMKFYNYKLCFTKDIFWIHLAFIVAALARVNGMFFSDKYSECLHYMRKNIFSLGGMYTGEAKTRLHIFGRNLCFQHCLLALLATTVCQYDSSYKTHWVYTWPTLKALTIRV